MKIAIDGPVASGKDTVGRKAAEILEMTYIDSGALFRAVGIYCLSSGIPVDKEAEVCRYLKASPPKITLRNPLTSEKDGRLTTVFLNEQDVSLDIRSPQADGVSSLVARHECVRDFLLAIQRNLAKQTNVVMSGRDIQTFVFPDADLKIFLTADEEVRARRRFDELRARGERVEFQDVLADMRSRDRADRRRPLRPLKKAPDAIEVDTTRMTIDEVVARIVQLARQ